MVDTARPLNALLALLPDNTSGLIEPQDARDWLVTTAPNPVPAEHYNFTAQQPGGSLVIGGNTVILSPVPWGVNGAGDVGKSHYLYISGGTGTAETVLITGGTAVAGAASGTLTFACANTHSGAWTVASATAGVKEAMVANPSLMVSLPVGVSLFNAECYVPSTCPGVVGYGHARSFVAINSQTRSTFVLPSGGHYIFRDFTAYAFAGDMTAGAVFDSSAIDTWLTVENVYCGATGFTSVWTAIRMTAGPSLLSCNNCWFQANFRAFDLNVVFPSISNVLIVNSFSAAASVPAASAAILLSHAAGGFIDNVLIADGLFAFGIYADCSAGGNCNEMSVNNFYCDRTTNTGIYVSTGGVAAHWELTNFRLLDVNKSLATGTGGQGIFLSESVFNWQISNGNIGYGARGIQIEGATDVTVTGVRVSPNYATKGIGAVVIAATGTTKNVRLIGCQIGTEGELVPPEGFGFFNAEPALAGLAIIGCTLDGLNQVSRLALEGTEVNPKIANNNGIGNVAKSKASAATFTFPVMDDQDVLTISGATAITAIALTNLREGQHGLIISAATVTWTAGATIGNSFTPVANQPYPFLVTGGKIYVG